MVDDDAHGRTNRLPPEREILTVSESWPAGRISKFDQHKPRRRQLSGVPFCAAALAAALALPGQMAAQEPDPPDPAEVESAETAPERNGLYIYFDCRFRYCDRDFFRREIPYVNYTRNPEDAQVQVLLTQQETGGGGRLFTIDFIGRGEFEGVDDRLQVATPAALANERQLTEIAHSVAIGLLRYIARTDQVSNYEVTVSAGELQEIPVAKPETDPWNFWTFRVGSRLEFEADERRKHYQVRGSFNANRVTDAIKLEFQVGGNYQESIYETSDTTSVTSVRESYWARGLNVWSLNAHWSAGIQYGTSRSRFDNVSFEADVAPALEYNIFPYSESTRRQFNILYTIGVRRTNYFEETVFEKTAETLPAHELGAGVSIRQPWGNIWGSLEFSQYLHDLAKNRIEGSIGLDLRLLRGFSLNVNAEYSRIRDQLNVPKGDATQEEVLLQQRVLLSGYEYEMSVGFSYTFGSIYSNVVNPRLEDF